MRTERVGFVVVLILAVTFPLWFRWLAMLMVALAKLVGVL